MGIAKKLILGTSAVFVVALTVVTILINFGVVRSSNKLLTSIMTAVEEENTRSADILNENVDRIATELDRADETTKKIVLDLYKTSYSALLESVSNQIFPLVEGFDFEGAEEIVQTMINGTEAVKWIRFQTSKDASDSEVYEFGKKTEGESLTFTHSLEGDFAYLGLEMQVSLSDMKAVDTVKEIFSTINEDNRKLAEIVIKSSEETLASTKDTATDLTRSSTGQLSGSIVLVMILVLVIVCLVLVFFTGKITRPLTEAVGTVQRIADGNLTVDVQSGGKDEVGKLLSAMGHMTSKLKEIVRRVAVSSKEVSLAADRIAETSIGSSQKITEQASSLEETTAAIEEMSAAIRNTAENAREANNLAQRTKTVTESGGTVMRDTITAMDELNSFSSKIGNITSMIGEIAFQTNLLALNAAVEAARAGEHGKGFAVVASEIRSLAQRVSHSAKEISSLIDESNEKTSRSVTLSRELEQKLNEMGESIFKVAGLMDEVTATAQEQAANVDHVNKAILQIDQVTQENATMVEQNASSSEGMASQARALLQLVSFFKTGEGAGSLDMSEGRPADLPALDSFEGQGRVPRLPPKARDPYQAEGDDSKDGFSEF